MSLSAILRSTVFCCFQFYLYDPRQASPRAELQTAKANRSLKRRYVMMLKAKEAKTVGLLAGTLGVGEWIINRVIVL